MAENKKRVEEEGFKEYNNCLVSNLAPHETPDTKNIKKLLKETGCYLARWTDELGTTASNQRGQWWYLVKRGKWDTRELNSHDRNEINKGLRNYYCKIINKNEYAKTLYYIYAKANESYSKLSKSEASYNSFIKELKEDEIVISAFSKETGEMAAYAKVFYYKTQDKTKAINISVIKILPEERKKSPSAALMNYICDYFLNKKKVSYVCDGEKSIRHVTNFQHYLEKYFKFKKEYCRLNIEYSTRIKLLINILYPLRKVFRKNSDRNRYMHNINTLLTQEEIRRSFK